MSGLALIRVWFGGMAKEEETAVLIYLGCCAVLAFATAILLALQGASPVAAAHAAFAVGAIPLVFAAMGHFVPVLTRSSGATGGGSPPAPLPCRQPACWHWGRWVGGCLGGRCMGR
jgi:hypothetical protein